MGSGGERAHGQAPARADVPDKASVPSGPAAGAPGFAVAGLVRPGGLAPGPEGTLVGRADDAAELEADEVAGKVTAVLRRTPTGARPPTQRAAAADATPLDVLRRRTPPALPAGGVSGPAKLARKWKFWEKDEAAKPGFVGAGSGAETVDALTTKGGKALAGAAGGGTAAGVTLGALQLAGRSDVAGGMREFGGGGVGGAVGVLTGGSDWWGARKENAEAERFGDRGMAKAAGGRARNGRAAVASGLIGMGSGAVAASAEAGSLAADAADVAGGALSVASGSVQVLRGLWRGGTAAMKLCRLVYGRAQLMLSPEGTRWKEAIKDAEKFKVAVNGVKVVLGTLAVVGGALAIASNPVGWAIGLAAAIAGGVYAAGKVAARVSNARDRSAAEKEFREQQLKPGAKPPPLPPRKHAVGSPAERPAASGDGPSKKEAHERGKAMQRADAVAQLASANARLAAELRDALRIGDLEHVTTVLGDKALGDPEMRVEDRVTSMPDRQLHDALVLLSALGIDSDQALAPSGQLLIEKKLSKVEAS